jgi:hypothetical protein
MQFHIYIRDVAPETRSSSRRTGNMPEGPIAFRMLGKTQVALSAFTAAIALAQPRTRSLYGMEWNGMGRFGLERTCVEKRPALETAIAQLLVAGDQTTKEKGSFRSPLV